MKTDTLFTMNNGLTIPALGYGTFTIDDESAYTAVSIAIESGYRHIDTASFYKNEKGIGKAVKESGISRDEIFITSKVWIDDLGYERTKASFEQSLEALQTDYLDLYLIHWPRPLAAESWKVLEELYREGRVRSIGVSNYTPAYLEDLIGKSEIVPAVNQVELHPGLQQEELVSYCNSRNIRVEAWSPIMKGKVLHMPVIQDLGRKYGKNPVQITLRWHFQREIICIPKSVNPSRMAENLNIFDFELSEEDMDRIAGLNSDTRLGFYPEYIYEKGFIPGD